MAKVEDVDVERRSTGELIVLLGAPGNVIERAGGLGSLARADAFEIAVLLGAELRPSARRRTARTMAAAFELGRRVEIARTETPEMLASPGDVAAWAAPRLTPLTHEELWMLGLDGRGCLRAARCIARGGLHGAAVRASDPVRAALRVDASAFVLVHNHPSGDPAPSPEDVLFTAQVAAAAATVGIPLLDHVVVARGGFACVPLDGPTERETRTTNGLPL